MDRDTVSGKKHFETILSGFRERNFDILVGTQMIAKGHDIPNVTLVGVVSADIGLGMPDFRAERTFQLLTQVAGAAGRGDLPGKVFVRRPSPGSLRGAHGGDARFPGILRERTAVPEADALPAVQRAGERFDPQRKAGRRAAEQRTLATCSIRHPKISSVSPAEAPVPRLKNEFR